MPRLATQRLGFGFRNAWWLPTAIIVSCAAVGTIWIDAYLAYVATSWVIFGLLGLSLVLVWGRGGMLSLGQTALYGIGGYIGSIAAINFAPLTGNTLIWSLPFGAAAGLAAATLVGWFVFYGRMGPLQSTIVTYTFTLVLWTGSVSFTTKIGKAVVGGDNGMSNIPGFVLGFGESAAALEPNAMFVTTVLVAAAVYLVAKSILRSPFGLIIDCVRLDPVKAELLGYDIRRFQLLLFMLSGAIAGIAGAMFGAWANYLNPSIFSVQEALLVPIYVLVGGLGTLAGPFVGALTVGGLSFWLGSGAIGGQTTLVMGGCLILLVLFLRKGLLGGAELLVEKILGAGKAADETAASQRGVQVNFDLLNRLRESIAGNRGSNLETIDVSKSFGGVMPVNRVSQSFSPGQVRCVIGPNGAGKSSYLKTCTGSYKPDAGRILLGGTDVTGLAPFQRVKMGLGIKMQKAQVFDDLTVQENLWVAAYSRDRDSEKSTDVAADMLKMLGMAGQANRPASTLSHGEQQWLDIGMVLCLSPDVILLDEPAAGMTKEERSQLSELVRALAEQASVVVVEHDMDFVRTLDADVTVLHQGSVFAQGCIEDHRCDERILDIYLGRRENVRDL